MSGARRRLRFRHAVMILGASLLIVLLAAALALSTGVVDRWARRAIVEQIEKATGTRAELLRFHFSWRRLTAEIEGLTLHGTEPEGTPPLFYAERLQVNIRLDSVWGRRISLGSLAMSNFSAHVRIGEGGASNFPGPGTPAGGKSGMSIDRLIALHIDHLNFENGELLVNDTRVPIVVQGSDFQFIMDYATEAGEPAYLGQLSWRDFQLAARRYLPVTSTFSTKFILRRNSFALTDLEWKLPRTSLQAQVSLASFTEPIWNFRYRGQLDLRDIRETLRKPGTPNGKVEFSGDGNYAAKKLGLAGRFSAEQIALAFSWFHAGGITARGTFTANQETLEVPDMVVRAMGGTLGGRLHMDFATLRFRADSQGRGFDLTQLLAAVDRPHLPVAPLHWAGQVDVNATTTWVADFKSVDSRGASQWSYPAEIPAGMIPAAARLEYHYSMDRGRIEFAPSEITTPASRITVRGGLDDVDSDLDLTVDTEDLATWTDFIDNLRGPSASTQPVGGQFHWQGQMTGPLASPLLTGRVRGTSARYGALTWDEVSGEIAYSADELRVTRARARRGRSSVEVDVALVMENWGFRPDGAFTGEASLVGAEIADLQNLVGTSYPVNGMLTGQFRGRGTRADPELTGLFDLTGLTAGSWTFDRARGQLTAGGDEVRITNAELRLPVHAPGAPAGLFTGNFTYHRSTGDTSFDFAGAGIPLEAVEGLQSARMPVGGRLNLQVRGQGPLASPQLRATLRLVDLKLGEDVVGSFDGNLDSDGRRLVATLGSAMDTGSLAGKIEVELGGDYPLTGEITIRQIDLDAFIVSALHLTDLTGHSLVDGHFVIHGSAARPKSIAVEANLSRITFGYASVTLENTEPVRLTYTGEEVRIEQAGFRGTDTDFTVAGFARFAGDRTLNLRVDGAVNLRLLGGFVPDAEATGRAQVNAAIAGTMSAPRFNGRVRVEGATARYGDFPTGLSNVTGDFNFDASRLVFENVSAESGGGQLTLGGAVLYGGQPLSYTINARSTQVRVRYPAGMSWLLEGSLRLSGNAQTATLSGRVLVHRLLMSQGTDISALMGSGSESVSEPRTSSSFLRNLQFDIQAESSPEARMEWTGARLQTEASLRVRGTWEHPILLGHIHLLSGEMEFRGNIYTISRGDINFSNPFRLDPVVNVQATTTIRQYEVTLDFTGPASRLTLAYRSDPPMPPNDIITLLALGRTGEESQRRSAVGGESQLGASTLLSEAISSQLGGRIERLFGISHFRVDPFLGGPTSGQNAIARVTIEQQVARGLVVTYITNVTSSQQQVIQIEYTVNREYSIVALRDQNGTFGLDVIRKTRFK